MLVLEQSDFWGDVSDTSCYCFPNQPETAMDSAQTKHRFEKLSVFQLYLPHVFLCPLLPFTFFKVQVFTFTHCYNILFFLFCELAHAWEQRVCC